MATLEEVQEIANRGIQDQLPPDKLERFNELVRRGTITLPEAQGVTPQEQPTQPQAESRGLQERALGTLEAILNLGTAAGAEAVSGIAGMARAVTAGPEEATKTIEQVREALTFEPRTEAGKEQVQAVAEVFEPFGEKFQEAQKALGDAVFEKTESPALAAAAATIPTALAELAGFQGVKSVIKFKKGLREAKADDLFTKAVQESAPSKEQLFDASRAVFKEIDDLGVSVKADAFKTLVDRLNKSTREAGLDPDITPKANKALQRLNERVGEDISLTDLDTLRKVAQNAAKSIDPADKALGVKMIDEIDSFLDSAGSNVFDKPAGLTTDISKRYKVARELWGRARRSELLQEAFEKARLQASGFENGIRVQFRSILNNKRQSRFFNAQEKAAMQKVVKGGKAENLFKLIGRFGFSEGQATNIVGGALGVGAGGLIGGTPGAILVPAIGTISRKLAQRLTARNAQFADQIVRAGKDAKKITSIYFKNTPKAQRSASELAELLMKKDIDLTQLPDNAVAKLAGEIAKENRLAGIAAVVTGAQGTDNGDTIDIEVSTEQLRRRN